MAVTNHRLLIVFGFAIFLQFLVIGLFQLIYVPKKHEPVIREAFLKEFDKQSSPSKAFLKLQEQAIVDDSSIPVFYNLYVAKENDASRVLGIVSEQMALLRPEHKPFFIQSMGATKLDIPKSTVLGHRSSGTEMISLRSMWQFCKQNPHVEKVVYLHSKGSSRNSRDNENLRKFLTRGALSEECAVVNASTCNVCSSRFSPLPHPHTSGNMWLARCDYVQQLIDPFDFEERMNEFTSNCTDNNRESCDGRLRYSAEHWIHSHPSVKPCDLYNDSAFVWDYYKVPENGEFEIELAKAPRFELLKYVKWRKCPNRGVRIEHRLDEYWGLYQQKPDEYWWGWNYLKSTNKWLPKSHKGANKWRKRDVCWRGVAKNVTEIDTKLSRTKKREYILKENYNSCPSGSRIEQGPALHEKRNATLSSSMDTKEIKGTKLRVLVMTAVPRTKRHVLAIWSQLECFTIGIDHVVVAAPLYTKEITTKIIELAKVSIPRLSNGGVSIQQEYFLNDRYDVGLWCDALGSLNTDEFDEFALINDSVFAMRQFSDVFDVLSVKNVSLSSLSYSYSPKNFEGDNGPEHFWVESVYRGFTRAGIDIFRSHSCVPADHPYFCPERDYNKDCIVDNFEHDLAIEYPCDKVYGIYPSDSPEKFLELNRHKTWARNLRYWRSLVADAQFPVAKVKEDVLRQNKDKMAECMNYYNESFAEAIDFSLALPRHERKWARLDAEIRNNAIRIMEFDEIIWKDWRLLKLIRTPFEQLATEQQSFLESSLDCGALLWNTNSCGTDS
mmetsp:Transcript_17110/g.37427  ORF Transcript_17110/g.37427 Transcript_17110/m.37427 type:complete len:780 (-) Transcript_17110:95-2434(-)